MCAGTPQSILTEENYKAHTTWHVVGETLIGPDEKNEDNAKL